MLRIIVIDYYYYNNNNLSLLLLLLLLTMGPIPLCAPALAGHHCSGEVGADVNLPHHSHAGLPRSLSVCMSMCLRVFVCLYYRFVCK